MDAELLHEFETRIWANVPHLERGKVVGASQMLDLTQVLREGAKSVFGLDLPGGELYVLGKLEANLPGGSVKMRPAAEIMRSAIASGRLTRNTLVFEATSGNFGIALGQVAKLGVNVIVLVSRKLQGGVLAELERSGVKTVDLDVDICPAPGVQTDPNLLVARIVASNVRERFSQLGLDLKPFDASRSVIEELLARQDVINLAKALAEAYGGFCPAQYENELNVLVHETVTGPEIESQLQAVGRSIGEFNVVCAFGTGGTSAGLSRFIKEKYGKKTVHVVFPMEGQDVAGIRTRSKAVGLPFYQPEAYAGQHDVDADPARKLLVFLARKGFDIGESSGLALYAVVQMFNYGVSENFVVILADGMEKYRALLHKNEEGSLEGKLEVTADQARNHLGEYGAVLWTHPGYVPNAEGIQLITQALTGGKAGATLEVVSPAEVAQTIVARQIPPGLKKVVGSRDGRVLLVCMSGNTSLKVAQVLSDKGVKAQSLRGGISGLARADGKSVEALIQLAG